MELEAAFAAELARVDGYELDGGRLTLTGTDAPLAFLAEVPPEPSPLVGTTWVLEAMGSGQDAVASPLPDVEVILELRDDGSAGGSGGCNTFRTTSELGDVDSIRFGPVVSTKKACEPDVMTQEAAVFAALEDTAAFTIEADVLTLTDEGGSFLLSYRASG